MQKKGIAQIKTIKIADIFMSFVTKHQFSIIVKQGG